MLWVRVPPELFENTSSRSSLECSPPCHGGDVGSNPIEDADMARYAIWKSDATNAAFLSSGSISARNRRDSVGSTPTRATALTTIARAISICKMFVIARQRASAEHWRAQVAVTHPPSGIGGSTPSRRTQTTKRLCPGSNRERATFFVRTEDGMNMQCRARFRALARTNRRRRAKWCNW